MPEFKFDPALTLKGNVVVRTLDDAVRFIIGYREAGRPGRQSGVLHRLEGAAGEAEERNAGSAFVIWQRHKTSSPNWANSGAQSESACRAIFVIEPGNS